MFRGLVGRGMRGCGVWGVGIKELLGGGGVLYIQAVFIQHQWQWL